MSVFMPHWPKPLGKRPIEIDLKLERILKVLKKLGNPQEKVPPIIHVAGTNGKGSTIAFIRSILQSSGYKVHVYTSPHLIYFNERIVIAGNEIQDDYLFQILEECRIATAEEKLTFFEGVTIAAILAFSSNFADICLIETGMGGRLDATNVFSNPLLTIITPISYDHTEYLGSTIAKIATEKAGIIKDGVTCITSWQKEEARKAIEEIAIKKRAPVFRCGFEWNCIESNKKLSFKIGSEGEIFSLPNLIGQHQITNAGNAISAITLLKNKFNYNNITYESINNGLENAKWPARLQQIKGDNELLKVLPTGWKLFLDGAHNTGGAEVISNWLGEEKCYFIIGMTRDKNTKEFLIALKRNIKFLYTVCVKSEPRSQTNEEIFQIAENLYIKARKADSIMEAMTEIIKKERDPCKIIICGSLFLARDVYFYSR